MKLVIVIAISVTAILGQRSGPQCTPEQPLPASGGGGGRARRSLVRARRSDPLDHVGCQGPPGTGNNGVHYVAVWRNPSTSSAPTCDQICADLDLWQNGGAGIIYDDSTRECEAAAKIYPTSDPNQPFVYGGLPCDHQGAHACCCTFEELIAVEVVGCGDGATTGEVHFAVPRHPLYDPTCDILCENLDLDYLVPEWEMYVPSSQHCTKAIEIHISGSSYYMCTWGKDSWVANVCCCAYDNN